MKLVYIAGPYSAANDNERHNNIEAARAAAVLFDGGKHPLKPEADNQ